MLSCYAILSHVYIDFCKKGSVKTTKYGVFACSDHMHVLYVEITRIPLRQIDFKLVSIVECFRRRGVWKHVKVVQIPMTKADLFLGIFEAIPGTLKCFEDFFVCWEASVTLFALPWLDAFFSIIQSAWSSNSVTAEELSECHKCKSFFTFQMKTTTYCVVLFQQIAGTVDRCFWTGQLKLFQRLTIFLTDSSRCSND